METKQMQQPGTQAGGQTRNLSKLTANANAVTWFEIPVNNMQRARAFYEAVLDIQLTASKAENDKEEMLLFPRLPDIAMGRSDMVSGSLLKSERLQPSGNGILIYLNANPSIDRVIARIEKAGGKILLPKTKNPAGYVCLFTDTEGNKMGIYAGAE